MKKQFKIEVSGKEKIVVDLESNQAVSIHVAYNAYAEKQNNPVNSLNINGNRWHDDEMDLLEWNEIELSCGDKISIELGESTEKSTPIPKDYLYVRPEEECSFCHKKKSEVEHLIAAKFIAHICNECVMACMELINEQKTT